MKYSRGARPGDRRALKTDTERKLRSLYVRFTEIDAARLTAVLKDYEAAADLIRAATLVEIERREQRPNIKLNDTNEQYVSLTK